MANVTKDYGIGDTVFVAYPFPSNNYFTAQSRIVDKVDVNSSTNEAVVKFTNGEDVVDGAVKTVYTTSPLASTAIINDVISKADTAANDDATTSLASTAAQPTLSLGRVDT